VWCRIEICSRSRERRSRQWADLVVFDPDTLRDLATFEAPNQFSVGMQYDLVHGVAVISEGKMTGTLPGQVLRGPGYPPPTGPAWETSRDADKSAD
jgi:N-acyl-D-aspartate/D-glutamate deacylase